MAWASLELAAKSSAVGADHPDRQPAPISQHAAGGRIFLEGRRLQRFWRLHYPDLCSRAVDGWLSGRTLLPEIAL
jgi:hypothetical protein